MNNVQILVHPCPVPVRSSHEKCWLTRKLLDPGVGGINAKGKEKKGREKEEKGGKRGKGRIKKEKGGARRGQSQKGARPTTEILIMKFCIRAGPQCAEEPTSIQRCLTHGDLRHSSFSVPTPNSHAGHIKKLRHHR